MIVEYFNQFGSIPMAQLIKETEEQKKDPEKSNDSLAPFAKKWQTKALLNKNKTGIQIKKDSDMILKAFFNADLDFDALSRIYIKSRQMPKECRNYVFEHDVTSKLRPIWPLYAPPGLNVLSVIENLTSMGDWLFPDPKPNQSDTPAMPVMPLIINKPPKKSRNCNSKHSQPNLRDIEVVPMAEVSFDIDFFFLKAK